MAVHYYTADKLITSIRRSALIPTNNNTFKEEDFLEMADEELALNIVPSIIRQHENYFLYVDNVPIEQNKTRYKIPSRAAGNKLKDLAYKDQAGNTKEMTMIPVEHISDYNQSGRSYRDHLIYYILNDEIIIHPETSPSLPNGFLVFTFYMKPNKLVKLDKVGVISAIDTNTKTITLSNVPSAFTSSKLYDFVTVQSPHVTLAYDIPIVSINNTTKTVQFDANYEFPSRLAVGDHLTIQCETAIPQIPSDLHAMLARKVSMTCLQALGDSEGLANATSKYNEIVTNVETIIDNRVEGVPKKLVNRGSFLRQSRRNNKGFRR